MNRIAVIDYGMGNLHSVGKALEHVADDSVQISITADEKAIMAADRIVFPGVGAMRDCMAGIKALGVDDMLRRAVEDKPVLAICVGMQALMEFSEENGGVDCIGLFPGRVTRFADPLIDPATDEVLKVPHMGWNVVSQTKAHPLWLNIEDNSRFYFVHGYYVVPTAVAEVTGVTDYPDTFCSSLAHKNIFAVQFHPEKSQDCGLQLLKNFISWDGEA
jgi:imidazole glycerol-phosphate synthase subunit HisH